MSELHRISERAATSAADVVFVHGLGGDPFATWWHDADHPRDSWPFWLAEELPEVAVYCLAYDASPSNWLGWSMPLVDRATNLLTLFEAEGVGGRPLFFICHSLGGLVVKQMLRSAVELGEPAWHQVVQNTQGIVFLATPHTGARLADYLGALGKIMRLSVSVQELEASAPALRDLNVWYRQKAQGLGIDTLALFETRDTHGVRVVDEASADPGRGVPRAIDSDHFSICKARARSDLVYGMTRRFLSRHFPAGTEIEAHASARPAARPTFADATRAQRSQFFISYSRRAAEDGQLANFLRAGLEQAGQDVFIDRGMRVGTDWVEEIARRIDWCDYLVVLLSEASIHSEMVLGEVRMAHRKRSRNGRPYILPIRVRYEGPLDYELDSYLARVQYLRWAGPADSSHVLAEIVAAAVTDGRHDVADAPAMFHHPPPPDNSGRPQPSEDMRALYPPPGGTIKLKDAFYIRRSADHVIDSAARMTGDTTLAIKAPRQFGKSSILVRYLAKSVEHGKKFALIDFQTFTDDELDDYRTLLTRLAQQILRAFRLDTEVPQIHTQAELTAYIEDSVLAEISDPLVFAFDEVDRVLGRAYQSDFFSMLRLWHNRRAEPLSPWDQIDLALVIATEPYLLIDSRDRSPFNVATAVEPEPFSRAALDDLNGRYRGALSPSELDDLHELLAGHPFLTRLAFHRIVTGQSPSFEALYAKAAEPEGPFGDHLRAMLVLLQQQKDLLSAMKQVIGQGSVPDDEIYYRLHGAGLAQREGRRVQPSNLLYARFFKGLG